MHPAESHEHREGAFSEGALQFGIWVSTLILVVEVLGGFWTNSLALLSDAAHVLMDLLSFILSLAAIRFAEKSVSDTRTFGWHRLEIFAAFINAVTVFGIALVILVQAVKRMASPVAILGPEMVLIALVGLAANILVVMKLHPHALSDLNIRSAFLHALGDAGASLAVIVGGVAVILSGKQIIDPIVAILVSLIIVVYACRIFYDAMHILLEGVPKDMDRNAVVMAIEEVAGNRSVTDLHIWNVCSHICTLTAHVELPGNLMAHQNELLENIRLKLKEKFNIVHTTIQIEAKEWQKPKT